MYGFILIDKPKDKTSFFCLKILRKIFNERRIGFVGTLDPLATGLMIFAIGEARKMISYLEGMDKVYEVKINLGAVSETYDANGRIGIVKNYHKPNRGQIEKIVAEDFLGSQMQMPPKFSAIQIDGKRAYDLARKGKVFNLQKRAVNFFEIKIKSYSWPLLNLKVHVSSGTYIRSLAHDLGQKLGCGAYVQELRRTKVGYHKVDEAVKLEKLNELNYKAYLIPIQEFFKDFKQMVLTEDELKILGQGGFILKDIVKDFWQMNKMPILAIYQQQAVGILEVKNGKLKFLRKFNIF